MINVQTSIQAFPTHFYTSTLIHLKSSSPPSTTSWLSASWAMGIGEPIDRVPLTAPAQLDSSAPRSWTVRLLLTHPLIPICLHLLPAPTHVRALRFFKPMYLDFVGIIPIITDGLEYTLLIPICLHLDPRHGIQSAWNFVSRPHDEIFGFSTGSARSGMNPGVPRRTKLLPGQSGKNEFTTKFDILTHPRHFPMLRHPYRIYRRVSEGLVFVFKAVAPILPLAPKHSPTRNARNYRRETNLGTMSDHHLCLPHYPEEESLFSP
ncbi:hypothetical protein ONZ45_g18154 [Pleurotus djamor]|nr:hypothetical protein ONZ45_g18154 [Pleurotus djamor]